MKCTVRWAGKNAGMSFIGESGSGHAVVMDGAPEMGGRNLGPRPMEMLLMGTGGCSAFDVVLILQKSRQNVSDCQVHLDATRAESDPKVFTKIHFHFVAATVGASSPAVVVNATVAEPCATRSAVEIRKAATISGMPSCSRLPASA